MAGRGGRPSLAIRFALSQVGRQPGAGTWVAVAFIVGLVLTAFWKLTLMRGVPITDDIFASDLMNENLPYRYSLGEALRAGQWPLWVREIYGGFPLLARSEAGICYPLNIILFGLLSPYHALNLTVLMTVATAGVGMYFYARQIGASCLSSTLGGVALAFCGFFTAHLKHLSMVNAACWLPIGVLFLDRAVERNDRRSLLWFGAVFGLQNVASNAQVSYYAALLYAVYFPLRLLNSAGDSNGRGKRRSALGAVRDVLTSRLTWCFGGMLVVALLLAAVQLLPTYELVSHTQRAGGVTFEYASKYAYDPKDFWTFLYPLSNGDIGDLTYTGKGIFWEDYGYVGALTFLLAIYAPLRRWKSWHVKFFSFAAVVSYLLVLGPATPLYEIVFNLVPGVRYFRFPTRLLLITDFSLIALACLGMTELATRVAAGRPRGQKVAVAIATALLAITVCDLLYFQLRQNPIVDAATWSKPPTTVEIVRQDHGLFRLFCLGGTHSHRQAFHAAKGWQGSLQPFVNQREFIQPSSNVLHGIASPHGYANLTPNYLVDIWGDQNRAGIITQSGDVQNNVFAPAPLFWKLMRMYNVKYLTSLWPISPAERLDLLGTYGGAHLYRNADFLPRSYLVGDAIAAGDDEAALAALRSEGFDPGRSVLLPAAPPGFNPGDVAGGSVEFVSYTTNEAEMKVRTPRAAILVFSDSYYPGWVADVDGSETPIYRANVTQRAVVVPAGEHHVSFRFRPWTVAVGFWISAGSLTFLVGCLATPWVRKRFKVSAGKAAQDLRG